MSKNPSKYVSWRKAASMVGLSFPAFKHSYQTGFFPFRAIRISVYRTGFRREDIEEFCDAEPSRIIPLEDGESLTAMRVDR